MAKDHRREKKNDSPERAARCRASIPTEGERKESLPGLQPQCVSPVHMHQFGIIHDYRPLILFTL